MNDFTERGTEGDNTSPLCQELRCSLVVTGPSHHRCHSSLYNEVVLSALTQRETGKAKRAEIEQYVGTFDKNDPLCQPSTTLWWQQFMSKLMLSQRSSQIDNLVS